MASMASLASMACLITSWIGSTDILGVFVTLIQSIIIYAVNAVFIQKVTAFMWACCYGHKDVVKLLFDYSKKIELNARNDNERTTFIVACNNGNTDDVKLFLCYSNSKIDQNNKDK